jgi:hypothetical protein
MTPFLGLLLILAITFIGVRFFSRSTLLKTPLFSGFIVSGVPYILMGVILGPRIFNFLNTEVITNLKPLISMAIGWVGLLFGLQLRWRNIRRFPRNYLLFTSLQSIITFLVIFFSMGIVLSFMQHPLVGHNVEALLILGAIGSMTAPLSIGRIVIENKVKGRMAHLLQFVSSLDNFWGIIIAGIAMAIYHQPALRWIQAGWQWIILSIIISVIIGLVFRYLLRIRFWQEEIFLIVLGLVIFTSGIGFYLKLSPIFMNMIVGLTIAQFHRESDKVMRVLHIAEKPTYVFLLVFAGACWNYRFWEEIVLIFAFILVRFAGKYIGGWISASNIDCSFPIPKNVGKALLSFGGISLALAFNFQLFYGGLMGDFIMSATILAILFFDEYTAISIRSMLKKQGELV